MVSEGNSIIQNAIKTMYCTNCGHTLQKDIKFCTNCGNEIHKKSTAKTETTQYTADEKETLLRKDINHELEKNTSKNKKSLDHTAFFHWLIVAVFLLIISFAGMPYDAAIVTIILGLLAGAYAYYIFQGGRFVIVNKYLELFVMLFTKGYNKKIPSGHPPSQAWIVWAVLTFSILLNTILGKFSNDILGIVTLIPAGLYTGYLLNGGRYVYVPIVIMLYTLGMLGLLFNG